jgi:nitrogen fixation NifU-like protein
MSDLKALYQEVILDHSKRPRNFRALEEPRRSAEGYNPLCGDKVTVYLRLKDDRIADLSFQGSGCAISTASASLLTETLKGKTPAEAEALFERFHDLVTGKDAGNGKGLELGKLAVFSGVSEFPARVKCATLAWHTLKSALGESHGPVSTEGADGEDLAAR